MGVEWPMPCPVGTRSCSLSLPLCDLVQIIVESSEALLTRLSLSSSCGVEGAPQIHEKLHTQQAQGSTSIMRASGQLPRLEAEMTDAQSL